MVASLRQQYGLRVQSEEFAAMSWDEFSDLVGGLNEQTPLVRVAQIRTESDRDVLKGFTPEQRRMRAEWQRRRALAMPQAEVDAALDAMSKAFAKMFGNDGEGAADAGI